MQTEDVQTEDVQTEESIIQEIIVSQELEQPEMIEIPEIAFEEVKIEEPFEALEETVLEFAAEVEKAALMEVQETEKNSELEDVLDHELLKNLDFEAEITELSEEQKELFSYITPIKGMEEQICAALNQMIAGLRIGNGIKNNNLVIAGGSGSGKTVFATNFIKVLQQITGKLDGMVGKIEADILNKRDICVLYNKIAGGSLIIESAGDLAEDSVKQLALLIEQDTKETLVILEDSKSGIKRVLAENKDFASKFTQRIYIPIFTNDELVTFAKSYAEENGYVLDEMGVLALYNCISNIQKLDRETTIAEVKEIVDSAIKHVESSTFRKAISILTSKRFSQDDYIILHEKDFNN